MNEWWGYLHSNGTVQVKRAFDERDYQLSIVDAYDSPFVQKVFRKFSASNRDDAIRIITLKLQETT